MSKVDFAHNRADNPSRLTTPSVHVGLCIAALKLGHQEVEKLGKLSPNLDRFVVVANL